MQGMLTLYHGTIHNIFEVDVQKDKPYKDFGRGFYLCESFERAKNIAVRNRAIETERVQVTHNATEQGVFVYEYEVSKQAMEQRKIKPFTSADREWLQFVLLNRMNKDTQHNYDIVIGPTANDNTRASIRAIFNASNGAVLSKAAQELLIEMLEPYNLPIQYFFDTAEAAVLLTLKRRHDIK